MVYHLDLPGAGNAAAAQRPCSEAGNTQAVIGIYYLISRGRLMR